MFATAILTLLLHPNIDTALAARYFQETEWASNDEGQTLWGKKLYGPTLFVDPQTGDAVGNQPDQEGNLKPQGGVFVGKVPNSFAAANTAKTWAGVKWSVIMWPLPSLPVDRQRLIMHESWHRIQDDIGLPGVGTHNDHLDSKDGRIWMLLEYRALAKALPAWGPERKQSLGDALTFRAYRRSIFPIAAENEDRMEVHEGMAEYTGFRSCGLRNDEARYYMSGRLKLHALKKSLAYAFAYETGPAYGLLLDQYDENWRKKLTTKSSLSGMLTTLSKLEIKTPTLNEAVLRAKQYDGDALIEVETDHEKTRLELEVEYKQKFVTGPRLHLPSTGNFTFDPNAVFPLKGFGTIYLGSKISEDWGILQVDGPVLIGSTYKDVWVPAPTGTDLSIGTNWKLTLNPGYKVIPGKRKGDFEVVKV